MAYDVKATESYIRQAAQRRGIDPDIAVRVARSEGLANGVYQSNIRKNGVREPSYGPFQLLVGGKGTAFPAGMGNDFIRQTGLDPRDPSTVPQQVDFALDNVLTRGWSPWYGAAKVGVGKRDGIGRNAAPAGISPPAPRAAPGSFRAAQDAGMEPDPVQIASSTSTAPIPTTGASPMASNYGGLGGLGGAPAEPEETGVRGFLRSDGFGDTLQAIGFSLLSSPGNAPLQNMPTYMTAAQRQRSIDDERELEREQMRQQQVALGGALEYAGFTPQEAQTFAVSPTAASTAVAARTANRETANRNKSVDYLRREYPDIANMVETGAIDAAQGVKLAWEARQKATGSDESFFGNPVPVQNADGSISYGQIGNKGTFKPIDLGDGQKFAPPTTRIDTGTEILITDQTGGVISRVPKDNYTPAADAARGGVEGKNAGERTTGLSQAEQTAERTLATLDRLESHPGLSTAVGWESALPNWMTGPPGSNAAGFRSILEQVQGQAFLQAFESLKGGGQITEIEGQRATAAITRLSPNLSEAEFKAAIQELRDVVTTGLDRARRGITVQSMSNPGAVSTGAESLPPATRAPAPEVTVTPRGQTGSGLIWSVE